MDLEITYDPQTLREVPKDPAALSIHVENLKSALNGMKDPQKRVATLGELGVRQRALGLLDEAEDSLAEALHIAQAQDLGLATEIQQKIRLAHVWHWQGEFGRADRMFRQVIAACEAVEDVRHYLPFALQHAGKSLFDQGRFADAKELFARALALRVDAGAPEDQRRSSELALAATHRRLEGPA
jgi:tetratricopeptide (TPR) repeat protein